MITTLPRWLRDSLELHGIENDQLSMEHGTLSIRCDTPEEAFELRDVALLHTSCLLTTHPTTRQPTVNLPELNQ